MDFSLKSGLPGFTVPFLVASQEINELILGYNVIEQVILNEEQKANLPLCLSTCYDNGKVEAVISLIQERSKRPDLLETIKVPVTVKIDGGNTTQIKCNVKISMDTQKKTIDFTPEVNENGGDELIFVEAIRTLKSQYIFIEVQNRTNKQIVLPKGKKMGTVHSVAAVIPMKMKNSEVNTLGRSNMGSTIKMGQVALIDKCEIGEGPGKWTPNVDLRHLDKEQRIVVENMLREESDVFSKSDCDIGDYGILR